MRFNVFITFIIVVILTIFSFQCVNESDSPMSQEDDLGSIVWSDQEVADFLATYQYPENRADYKIQFLGNIHRSNLNAEQLAVLEAKEARLAEARDLPLSVRQQNALSRRPEPLSGSPMQIMTTYSSTFWACTDYDSDDWIVFDDANMIFGNQTYAWETSPWEWGANTSYMTNYTTTTQCYGYLNSYASNIVSYSSASPYDDAESGDEPVYRILKASSSDLGNILSNPIDLQAISSWDRANLNPSFELYDGDVSGYPDAWNIGITGADNIPASYENEMNAAYITRQSTLTPDHGDYYVQIYGREPYDPLVERSLSTAYFMIPSNRRETYEDYTATIFARANTSTSSSTYAFSMTLYEADGTIIGTDTRNVLYSNSVWTDNQVIVTSEDVDPVYVRFALTKTGGRNYDYWYFDNLSLHNEVADISLPVEFAGIFYQDYVSSRQIRVKWHTDSELNNLGFKLFYKYGSTIYPVSDEFVSGEGNTSSHTDYDETFYIDNSMAWLILGWTYELEVFIGAQDSEYGWEYFEDDAVTVDYP